MLDGLRFHTRAPRTDASEQQPEDEPEKDREQHGEVAGDSPRGAPRLLVVGRSRPCERVVPGGLQVRGGDLRSGASVRSPKISEAKE